MMTTTTVPWPYRAAFYGINVLFVEVLCMALWDFYHSRDPKLVGYSSVWALLLYGVVFVIIEQLYFYLRDRGCHLALRAVVYAAIAIFIELIFGLVLSRFDALAWDYSANKHVSYHFMGLIALESVPVWGLGCYFLELQSDFILNRLSYNSTDKLHTE